MAYDPNAMELEPLALADRPNAVEAQQVAVAPNPYEVWVPVSDPIGAMPSRLGSDALMKPDEPVPTNPEGSGVGIGV